MQFTNAAWMWLKKTHKFPISARTTSWWYFFFFLSLIKKKKPFCKTGALFESITAPYVISANAKGPVQLVAIVTCPGDGHLCGYGSSYNCISVYRHAMRRVEINLRVSCCTPARSRKFTQWKFTRRTLNPVLCFYWETFFLFGVLSDHIKQWVVVAITILSPIKEH